MSEIPFKATIRKVGHSHMITVPAKYIGSELKKGQDVYVVIKTEGFSDNNSTTRGVDAS